MAVARCTLVEALSSSIRLCSCLIRKHAASRHSWAAYSPSPPDDNTGVFYCSVGVIKPC
ncbi:hypothetical protein NDK47_06380 [Brevibacillus ruminantium]|uniref:Uncharacterized protein n=1 Tax=Brevibacillus ruminantium TaxID=2950604 RepID=A0ABY4WND3_9BACL|nr:hypothetical protein [Brevibacillus ruminantium]USG66919.1 hypothetical protein NDK47_06380 [Brevibacillus ruminantium]